MASAKPSSLFNTTDGTFHINNGDLKSLAASNFRIMTANFWLGILLTLAIALVLLSTAQQRKGAIFVTQFLAFLLALVYNSLLQLRAFWKFDSTFRMPGERFDVQNENRVQVTCLALEHWVPLITDLALVFKLVGFYPTRLYSTRQRALRLSPPTMLLVPRFVLVSYVTYLANNLYSNTINIPGQVYQNVYAAAYNRFVLISTLDFGVQAGFCLYASCALLFKSIDFYRNIKQIGGPSVRQKLRFFMEAVFMTFIPPLALSILCAILLQAPMASSRNFREAASALLNTSVLCSLLATSWSTIRGRSAQEQPSSIPTLPLISQMYQSSQSSSTQSPELPMVQYDPYRTDDLTGKTINTGHSSIGFPSPISSQAQFRHAAYSA